MSINDRVLRRLKRRIPATPSTVVLSDKQIKARVFVPAGMVLEETSAYQRLISDRAAAKAGVFPQLKWKHGTQK